MSNVLYLRKHKGIENYTDGGALQLETKAVVSDPENLSRIFSLAFRFKEEAIILIQKDNRWEPSQLDYDDEAKNVTELYLKSSLSLKVKEGDKIRVRMIIFNVCYEFSESIIEIDKDEEFDLLINPPESVSVIKDRTSSRNNCKQVIELENISIELNKNKIEIFEITNLSLNSIGIRFEKIDIKETEIGSIKINEHEIGITFRRLREGISYFDLSIDTFEAAYEYYLLYVKLVHDDLIPRSKENYDELFELFCESGYFSKFKKEDKEEFISTLTETWKMADNTAFRSIDLIAKGEDGRLTGSSSLSYVAEDMDSEIWFFHQLCSLKDPDLLHKSGMLYYWRSEFLKLLKNNIDVCGYFISKSRWLERVYVKFEKNAKTGVQLQPISIYRLFHEDFSDILNNKEIPKYTKEIQVKTEENRLIIKSEDFWGGLSPDFLNISGMLNIIHFKNLDMDLEGILSCLKGILETVRPKEIKFLNIATNIKHDLSYLKGSSDRFFRFEKDKLFDFNNSLKHSIAVTQKKYRDVD